MSYISKLPFEMIETILEYLKYYENIKFVSINKKIRRDHLVLNLNIFNSNIFIGSPDFQEMLLKLVNNEKRRIGLKICISMGSSFELMNDILKLDSYLLDVNIGFCHYLKDLSPLSKCRILNISYCRDLTDVSGLKNCQNLIIRYCDNFTDVSALGTCKKLKLIDCNGITDVSKLGTCQNITDVSKYYRCIKIRNMSKFRY